jgi:AcrR family transcriptional regulator
VFDAIDRFPVAPSPLRAVPSEEVPVGAGAAGCPRLAPDGGREAILDAAAQLLVTNGLVALTAEAVAGRAHIEASAISRWWPSEEALALDALRHEWLALAGRVSAGTGCVER